MIDYRTRITWPDGSYYAHDTQSRLDAITFGGDNYASGFCFHRLVLCERLIVISLIPNTACGEP